MKKLFYFFLAIALFNCGPDDPLVEPLPEILDNQFLTINTSLFGEIKTAEYDTNLAVQLTNDTLIVLSEDSNFDMRIDTQSITDSVCSPSWLRFPLSITGGPSGNAPSECKFYPCENYRITFSEMDFNSFGVIAGSIFARHENNPEEVQIFGDFLLQLDE